MNKTLLAVLVVPMLSGCSSQVTSAKVRASSQVKPLLLHTLRIAEQVDRYDTGPTTFCFSPDGKKLLVAWPWALSAYNTQDLHQVWRWKADGQIIDDVSVSGARLAVVYRGGEYGEDHALPSSSIGLRRLSDGKILHSKTFKFAIDRVKFVDENQLALLGSRTWVYDAAQARLKRDIGLCGSNMDLAPDASKIACGFSSGQILIRDVDSGQGVRQLSLPINDLAAGRTNPYAQFAAISHLQFFPDNRRLMVTALSQKAAFAIWDSATGQMLKTFNVGDVTLRFAISPDGQTVACAGWKRSVSLWDVSTQTMLWSQGTRAFDNPYCGLAFSPSGGLLARQVDKHTIQIWKLK